MRNKQITLFLIFLFTIFFESYSQKLVNSPFSRFNIGSLDPAGSFRSQGMGGISVAMRDNSSIFFTNPASYSSLDTNSFVFDFGLDYSLNRISDSAATYKSDDLNFDHLIMGFPLAKGWGVALGIVPYSNGYFSLSDEVLETDPGYDPVIGTYDSKHYGQGSLTKFFVGTGAKIINNLSAGANMTLIFGDLSRTNKFEFNDVLNSYHNNSSEKLNLTGISLDFGLQYAAKLKNNNFLNAGISVTTGSRYNVSYEHFSYKYTAYSTLDTISYSSEDSRSAYIPGTFMVGVSFGKINKLTAGLDFVATNWSKSKIPGSVGYAADTRNFHFGLEYTPDKFSNYSVLKRLDYRVGFHAGDNYLVVDGNQVKEFGASAGLGIPLRRSFSKTNIFFDFTRRNGMGNVLNSENYYTIGVSLNLYDWWFLKQKYD